ncbi:MAG: hypothetical protein ACRDE2_01710 [Chitinophagaceae bacterium]
MSLPDPKNIIKKIHQTGIIPMFHHEDPEILKSVIKACYDGGIRVFELMCTGARTKENFVSIKKYIHHSLPEMYLGAGGIKDAATADTFIHFNSDFISCPILDKETGDICKRRDTLWIPGCATTSEIAAAEKNGADVVRLFPGESQTTSSFRVIKTIFPDMQFIMAGGIDPSAAGIIPWLETGIMGAAMGRRLISPEMLTHQHHPFLRERVKKLLKTIRQWKQQSIA